MALCKNPLLSLAASGALGGIEYRNGIYGPMVGRRSIASYSATPLQRLTRSRLVTGHRAWEALSDADRESWNAHATYPSTGRNTFIAMWTRFTLIGLTPLERPLAYAPMDSLINIKGEPVEIGLPQLVVYWDLRNNDADVIAAFITSTYSHRSSPTISQMRYHSYSLSGLNYIYINVASVFPITHVRLDQISLENGDLISRHLIRIPNPSI